MAKVVTENFRVESANEFVKSYRTNNEAVVRSFETGLTDYSDELPLQFIPEEDTEIDGQRLTDKQIVSITEIARANINTILPQNTYYVMASAVDEDGDVLNTQASKREFQRRCIFGNKISEADVRYMFRTNNWISGVVYSAFDDSIDMQNENFYVTVLDGDIGEASFKVFKCIRNNQGGLSTVRPSTSNLDIFFETTLEDGYVWKYMFDVPAAEYLVFATSSTLPYVPDNTVIQNARERISNIVIENTDFGIFKDFLIGNREENSLTPTQATILSVEIDSIPDNTYAITIQSENVVRSSNGAYKNMYIRIVSTGEMFEVLNSRIPLDTPDAALNKILTFIVRSDTNIVGRAGLTIDLAPIIEISRPDADPDGIRALAYGILDWTGTVRRVEFKEKGFGYKAASATLRVPDSISDRAENNIFRVIMSPLGGHGYNPVLELFMSRVAISTNFFNDTLRFTPASNTYTKVALIKNPEFVNGVPPLTFDNRVKLTFEADLEDQFPVGYYVTQQSADGQVIDAYIHETVWDPVEEKTFVYLYDTIGPYNAKFTQQITANPQAQPPIAAYSGQITVKATPSSPEVVGTFVINNVETEKYVPYTGQILHFVNFDPITRAEDRREKIKLVFDF
jgi:hypothetical protein